MQILNSEMISARFLNFQPTNTVYEPKLSKDVITKQLIMIAIDNRFKDRISDIISTDTLV